MTDQEFYDELAQIVARRAATEHLVDTLAFVREVAERLEDDPVFGEFVLAEYSGSDRKNRPFRLHGFTRLDESDGSLGVVIGRWSDAGAPETLLSAAVSQLAALLDIFVHESVSESLCDRMAEAGPAYEVAVLLKNSRNLISRIRLHVLSNQPLSQRFKEQLLEPVGGLAVELHVWDLQRLRSIYQSSRERDVLVLDVPEFGAAGIECMQAARTSTLQSYVCIIPGTLLADMFERYGSRLLEGNVRSFLGMKGGVNKGIRRTIQDSPELFLAFNNGIAATAASVTVKESGGRSLVTSLVDLQIVNGGQTTASILNARKKDRLSLEGVTVAMKLTVVSASDANELIPRIAEYANTQNKVAIADFFANHPFHRKMEEISRRLTVPVSGASRIRSKWFYERARGQYQNERLYLTEARKKAFDLEFPSGQVISKTDLAKYDSVLGEKPHWISLGAQKNFIRFATTFEGKGADTVSSDHWNEISPRFGDDYYRRIVAVSILWRHAESVVSSARDEWYRGDYRAQIVAYGLATLVHRIRMSGNEPDWGWISNTQDVPSDLSSTLKDAAVEAQSVILSPPAGMTNVGEWTKKEACWERASTVRLQVPDSAPWLLSRDSAREQQGDARKQGRQDDVIVLQKQLLELASSGYWAALAHWPRLSHVATDSQRALVGRASTVAGFMRIATEKDWRRLVDVRKACEDAGFRFPTDPRSARVP